MSKNEGGVDLSISDFFKGKSVFITGGSGFIGKVLIEKLLRSCPDLKYIFLLIRPKRNASIEERIRHMTDTPLFDKLRNENKNFLDKIIPVNGNIKELKLGISEEDRQRIIHNVTIIYHSAASVRFDDSLKDAVFTNVRSTREIMNLAQEFKTIDTIVHVSTLYANADNKVLEEKLYHRHAWVDAINLVECCEDSVLEVLTQKYIHPLPNTYTFTKSVAESVVDDFCRNKIPAVIIRPSIVIPSGCDPIVGWVDNYNGPMGLNVAGAKGILKSVYCDPQIEMDHVFVDNVIKSMIVATCQKSIDFRNQKKDIMVCNVSSDLMSSLSLHNESALIAAFKNPPMTYISTVCISFTACWPMFFIRVLFLQILPALLMDVLLAACGKKLRIMKIQRKAYIANMALIKFMFNEWDTKNNNYLSLIDAVKDNNKKDFSFFRPNDKTSLDLIRHEFWPAVKVYLMKEKPMATKSEIERYRLLYMTENILKLAFLGFILYLVTWRYALPIETYQIFTDYLNNLNA